MDMQYENTNAESPAEETAKTSAEIFADHIEKRLATNSESRTLEEFINGNSR